MPGSALEGSHRLHLAALLRPVPHHVCHQEQHSLRLRFVVQPIEASTTEDKSEQHIVLETSCWRHPLDGFCCGQASCSRWPPSAAGLRCLRFHQVTDS